MQNQNPGSESHLSNGNKGSPVTTTSALAGPSFGPSLSGSLEATTKANPMDIPMASPSDGAQSQPQIQSQSQSHSPTSPLFRSLTPTQASTSAVVTSGTPNSALATATVPSTAHQVPLSTMEAGTSFAQHVLNAAQRKQNIACDGCRSRKVKCVRQPGSERCDHCRAKKTPCTSHYVTSLSSSRRKTTGSGTNSTSNVASSSANGNGGSGGGESGRASSDDLPVASGSGCGSASISNGGMAGEGSKSQVDEDGDGTDKKRVKRRKPSPSDQTLSYSQAPELGLTSDDFSKASQTDRLTSLLAYLFSPHPVVGLTGKWRDPTRTEMTDGMPYSPTFWDRPSKAHLKLNSDEARRDLASDLVETYFQIVHIRLPLLDPSLFRRRFHDPDGPDGPPFWPILACVLAWGAKFSEHGIIAKDREECSVGLQGERKRSRLIQMVAVRAQSVAEICKVYRVPSLENVQACLMLNVLEGGNINVPNDYVGMWGKVACTHLVNLRYHKREVLQSMESKRRASVAFTFWMTCWADGASAAFYGYKPQLLEGDWDVEPQQAWSAASESSLNPMSRLEDFLLWSDSNTGLCRVSRSMATYLWQPGNETQGIPLNKIKQTVQLLTNWRDEYLTRVGVPTVWPETWNFIAAVTACTEDADYHIHWTCLAGAIKKCGIKELKRTGEAPLLRDEAEDIKARIEHEALHGALRISALAGVLTQNSYLRLDPNVLFPALYRSGVYLAEAGRIECMSCIAGLRQYGLCFEEAFDRADELAVVYQRASNPTLAPTGPSISAAATQTLGMPAGARHAPKSHQSTYPFPPSLAQMTLPASNDFGYGVPPDLGNGAVSQEFYGLADQHGMNQMFYNER
ncbi:hypothetical protein HD553DRAFT_93191 [Filobasidium floriforme]|uniref:uncharacterized protein n=1 Tax=Filobasidium floriforme TaxID=5210 RepID=UPI001E8DC9F7|nr:uncharacterized protein HD553DRAFT_93191 [Filobasidium floriforme]KAH8089477.1 hypothetical protein HD553DRAFT_93191 [Filobasidium floriforme]